MYKIDTFAHFDTRLADVCRYPDTENPRKFAKPKFRTHSATSKGRHIEMKFTFLESAPKTPEDANQRFFYFKGGAKCTTSKQAVTYFSILEIVVLFARYFCKDFLLRLNSL